MGSSVRVEKLVVRLMTGKWEPYAAGGVAGLVGAYFGMGVFEIMALLLLGYAVAFFGPYQVRRLIRLWRKRRA